MSCSVNLNILISHRIKTRLLIYTTLCVQKMLGNFVVIINLDIYTYQKKLRSNSITI